MRTRSIARYTLFLAILPAVMGGCSGYRDSGGDSDPGMYLDSGARATISQFRVDDPSLSRFFDAAYGYAVFPSIGKGGFIAGGASGEGVVYRGGGSIGSNVVGYSKMTQITIGAQIGGQEYSQIMFFQDAGSFARFTNSRTEFAATASAVIVRSGGAATNDYNQGVAIFVKPKSGAMAEAALGGQKFTYRVKP